jgi:hypothetical protein
VHFSDSSSKNQPQLSILESKSEWGFEVLVISFVSLWLRKVCFGQLILCTNYRYEDKKKVGD